MSKQKTTKAINSSNWNVIKNSIPCALAGSFLKISNSEYTLKVTRGSFLYNFIIPYKFLLGYFLSYLLFSTPPANQSSATTHPSPSAPLQNQITTRPLQYDTK